MTKIIILHMGTDFIASFLCSLLFFVRCSCNGFIFGKSLFDMKQVYYEILPSNYKSSMLYAQKSVFAGFFFWDEIHFFS